MNAEEYIQACETTPPHIPTPIPAKSKDDGRYCPNPIHPRPRYYNPIPIYPKPRYSSYNGHASKYFHGSRFRKSSR